MKDVTGGYWGIVIVISAFMIQVIALGISLSFGVYNIELLAFTDDTFAVSLVSAINIGVMLGSGPVCSFLMRRMAHRTIVLIGAGLSSAGLICMPFLPSLGYMYAIYGCVTGLGHSLVFIPSHVLCGLYFVRHQTLATGLAIGGLGMGLTVFPIIISSLVQEFTWRPSFFILAGFALNLFVFGSLLRPLPKKMLPAHPKEESDNSTKFWDHFSIFCNPRFDAYCFINLLWNAAITMMLSLGPAFLTTLGLTSPEAASMFTIFGACAFIGSVVIAIVGNLPRVNRMALYAFVCLIAGVAVSCFPLVTSTATILADLALQGLGFGGLAGLMLVLTSDIVGIEHLEDGQGFVMFVNGLACFSGPVMAGALKDAYGSYPLCFYVAGGLFLTAFVTTVLFVIGQKLYPEKPKVIELEVSQTDQTEPEYEPRTELMTM